MSYVMLTRSTLTIHVRRRRKDKSAKDNSARMKSRQFGRKETDNSAKMKSRQFGQKQTDISANELKHQIKISQPNNLMFSKKKI